MLHSYNYCLGHFPYHLFQSWFHSIVSKTSPCFNTFSTLIFFLREANRCNRKAYLGQRTIPMLCVHPYKEELYNETLWIEQSQRHTNRVLEGLKNMSINVFYQSAQHSLYGYWQSGLEKDVSLLCRFTLLYEQA